MLSDPNDDSPANIDAAVRPPFFSTVPVRWCNGRSWCYSRSSGATTGRLSRRRSRALSGGPRKTCKGAVRGRTAAAGIEIVAMPILSSTVWLCSNCLNADLSTCTLWSIRFSSVFLLKWFDKEVPVVHNSDRFFISTKLRYSVYGLKYMPTCGWVRDRPRVW